MVIEHLEESERSQVVEILREFGTGSVVTLHHILNKAPWLHPQRVSASLYSLYKVGDLKLSELKGARRSNQYIVLDSIHDEHVKKASVIGYEQKPRADVVAVNPEDDSVSPRQKAETVDMLIDAAILIEDNYLNDALEAIRASYFKLKKAIEER